jgi:putative ABC transport system ATP-binding protein
MSEQPVVEARGIYHEYRHGGVVEPVLRDLDLTVRRGEFVVIMGPSGCGKTTLLNILGLMMPPTRAASLRILGVDSLRLSDQERARLRRHALGFVFQRFNLLPTISARKNVELPLRIARQPVDGSVDRLIERVGLSGFADKKPGQLSMGQQQRFALARAMIMRPALLLADEPTGNLDSANAQAVLELLTEVHREWGQTIILITHNERLTVRADRVLHMRDGRFVD